MARRLPGYAYSFVIACVVLLAGLYLLPTDRPRYGAGSYEFVVVLAIACLTLPLAIYMLYQAVFGEERSWLVAVAALIHALPGVFAITAQLYRLLSN